MEVKKILVGFIMDGKSGGVDRYLLNFLNAVWQEGMQIDFLSDREDKELKQLLKKYHSRVYRIDSLWHPLKQYRQVKYLIQREGYEMTYLNISTSMDCIAAAAAKHCKVPRRLLHSHSGGNDCENVIKKKVFDFLQVVCRKILYRTATEFYGCSVRAGEWMYPKKIVCSPKFHVIYNAVDRERFAYDPDIRERKRKALGLEECFVIGHVGNFCFQKNHAFLIRIFKEIYRKDEKARLLLIGQGVRMEQIRQMVQTEGLQDTVLFLGQRQDVEELFQAMDVFVLPSCFEGLPTVGVEAQCTKLPCVMSSRITEEAKITQSCCFESLDSTPERWAEVVLAKKNAKRDEVVLLPEADNYDLKNQREALRRIIYGKR